MTNPVCWGTQGGDFNNSFTSKVEILQTNFHIIDSHYKADEGRFLCPLLK